MFDPSFLFPPFVYKIYYINSRSMSHIVSLSTQPISFPFSSPLYLRLDFFFSLLTFLGHVRSTDPSKLNEP